MNQSCNVDHGGCPEDQVSEAQLQEELKTVPEWRMVEGEPRKIRREFKFDNYLLALNFTNKVAAVAENLNHHPDILLKWGSVTVDYWTHNAGGISTADFHAARLIDEITK